jgi:hypothetical protein
VAVATSDAALEVIEKVAEVIDAYLSGATVHAVFWADGGERAFAASLIAALRSCSTGNAVRDDVDAGRAQGLHQRGAGSDRGVDAPGARRAGEDLPAQQGRACRPAAHALGAGQADPPARITSLQSPTPRPSTPA